MNQEQLAQLQQLQQMQQQQALAQGQPQQPVQVAGCGPLTYGGYGAPFGGFAGFNACGPASTPLPFVPPPNLIGPNAIYQSSVIPLGFGARFDENGNVVDNAGTELGTAIEISVGNNSQFYVCGIRTFQGPSAIQIDQIAGGGGFNVLPGPVDAAVYNTDDCFCPIDLPCISPFSPITITARATPTVGLTTTPQVSELTGALFGYWIRNLTGCSPISTLPLMGSGPLMPPAAYAAGPCPPTGDMGAGMYGMPSNGG